MTLENIFNLNLLAESQYCKVKILGERNKNFEINFKYEKKLGQIYNLLVQLSDWSVSHLDTELNEALNGEQRSVLVIWLFNKGNKGE